MNTYIVLYNPLAGNGTAAAKLSDLEKLLPGDALCFYNMLDIKDYVSFFGDVPDGADIIVCGGDGTLNRFLNDTEDVRPDRGIYYYPSGSGNDFARDVGASADAAPVCIDRYIERLPEITVNGEKRRFINGIGYGIDGYCCEKGDELRGSGSGEVNYTAIAIKGLLFHYKPTGATVIVDGTEHRFEKVWLAPTMIGRYYGGGMMPTPAQDRLNPDGTVSVMLYHGSGKLKSLAVFPSIFKGEHIKHTEMVTVLSGRNITVRFDEPRPLQIDGETISGVREYSAVACEEKVLQPA